MESYKELTGGQWIRTQYFHWFYPYSRELRSCKLHGTAKINKYISRLILHVTFEVCLLSIGRMHLPLIRVVVVGPFFIAVHYFILVVASCFSIHPVEKCLGCFPFLAVIEKLQ